MCWRSLNDLKFKRRLFVLREIQKQCDIILDHLAKFNLEISRKDILNIIDLFLVKFFYQSFFSFFTKY